MTQSKPFLFDLPAVPTVDIAGEQSSFPVYRVFCVGRNYAAHAAEMGYEVDREAPFYFTKSAHAILSSGCQIPYPPGSENYHYEMEFVVAIGQPTFRISVADALSSVYGYAAGFDMTRRDLQLVAREKGRPWDLGKDFEQSAVISSITPIDQFGEIKDQRISLTVNGEIKQDACLADLIWQVPELISHLSHYYHLQPGDLIYTGTPAGVGSVIAGDQLVGEIEGLASVALTLTEAEK